MSTAVDFVVFCAEFVPFLLMLVILIAALWIAVKLIPSLNEWMTSTDGMAETSAEAYERRRTASPTFDQYV